MRYFVVFLIPLLAATALFYATPHLRQEVHRSSAEVMGLVFSKSAEARPKLRSHFETGVPPVFQRLRLLAIGTMISAAGIAAMAIGPEASTERKVNLMTAMAMGFCVAKLCVGFGFLDWRDFAGWMIPALGLAALVVWLRASISVARKGSA